MEQSEMIKIVKAVLWIEQKLLLAYPAEDYIEIVFTGYDEHTVYGILHKGKTIEDYRKVPIYLNRANPNKYSFVDIY